jgi:hypothetical protein
MRIDFSNLKDTYNELISDVEAAKKLDTDQYPEAFIKRTYTRSFFSMVEGVTYQMKQISLEANKEANVLNTYEVSFLRELVGQLDEKGKASEKKLKLQLLPNLQFALRSISKVLAVDFEVDKGKKGGWDALRHAVDIRDRITHPKKIDSLLINDQEMLLLGQANAWFRDEIARLIKLIRKHHDVV